MAKSTQLEVSIQQMIKDHLPQATATQLQKFIEQADIDREELKKTSIALGEAQEEIKDLEKSKRELGEELGKYRLREVQITAKETELKDKEEDLHKIEIKFQLSIQEIKTQEAEKRAESLLELTRTVFRNPRLVVSEQGSRGLQPVKDQWGNMSYPSVPESKTTTYEEQ